ncbi:hypothetical protein HMPREF9555_00662 [Selenomonas artemidis F0399]|uniref:Uncharacterized protein n=1 Tax=Selenomonas artemidis F0399 TaxID=749551 RepID=E7N111_9FIRM|nr:hypothetical protein HMPREF9555_00662 [Selenomonas artemidis F0399]
MYTIVEGFSFFVSNGHKVLIFNHGGACAPPAPMRSGRGFLCAFGAVGGGI